MRGRIAALTAAALFALFASQPLHGAAAVAAIGSPHAAASVAADPGAGAPFHHADLCPLCRAANQARVATVAALQLAVGGVSFRPVSHPVAPVGAAHSADLSASGPRAPPRSLSPLV